MFLKVHEYTLHANNRYIDQISPKVQDLHFLLAPAVRLWDGGLQVEAGGLPIRDPVVVDILQWQRVRKIGSESTEANFDFSML